MLSRWSRRIGPAALFSALAVAATADLTLPPAPTRHFNDRAALVDAATAEHLDEKLRRFEEQTGGQVVVAVFPQLGAPSSAVCWLVGRAGAIRLTMDGVRFQRVPFPESVDLVGVRATSATSASVTAADGREFRTDDQGATWSRVAP